MSGFANDQAEGLRRLLAHDQQRVIAFVSGKSRLGQTSAVLNIAAACAAQGSNVLIIDEGIGEHSASQRLGRAPGKELAQALRGETTLAALIYTHPSGIQVLPAREGLRRLTGIGVAAQEQLARQFAKLAVRPDLILLDLAVDRSRLTLPALAAADDIVALLSPDRTAITQAYAFIKQLALEYGQRRLHLLACKVQGNEDADAVYSNMREAAHRYLHARLACLSPIVIDDALKRANKFGKMVLEAFPESASSHAYRSIAHTIAGWPLPADDSGRLEAFLHRLIMMGRMSEAGLPA